MVAETAALQDVEVDFDGSVIDHLAEVGYDPEFGARMLKRKIRTEVESRLATAILKGDVKPGARVRVAYDPVEATVKLLSVTEEPPPRPAPKREPVNA